MFIIIVMLVGVFQIDNHKLLVTWILYLTFFKNYFVVSLKHLFCSLPVEMAGMGLTMNPFLLQNLNQILAGGMGGPLAGMLGGMGGMGGMGGIGGMQQGWAPQGNMWAGEQQKVGIIY